MTIPSYICELSELDDPGSRGFSQRLGGGGRIDGFLVRRGSEVYAYLDSCPHTGVSLAWMPDEYLDLDRRYIECSMHGAVFTLDKGYCLRGPCAGRSLTPLDVMLDSGRVMVNLPVSE